MIDQTIVEHLKGLGWTAYRAGENEDINRKPCVVVSVTGTSKPWLPLQATEYEINVALYDSKVNDERGTLLINSLENLECGEKCDLFQLTGRSAGLEDDDWVTTLTYRYIEQ